MKLNKFLLVIVALVFTIQMNAQTVYITKTGEKYHTGNCHYLKYSKKDIELKKAIEFGYRACKVCKPNRKQGSSTHLNSLQDVKSEEKIETPTRKTVASQCTGKTKAGNRCKRRTKNSNGRCYQH